MAPRSIKKGVHASAIALMLGVPAVPAQAEPINFVGVVSSLCILSASPGTMMLNAEGTEIGTEETGGAAATLLVTSTGGPPTITFTAPILSGKPVAYSRNPAVRLKYSSPGGAARAYTGAQTSYTSTNGLTDTVTLDAKASDNLGFLPGDYTVSTTATCTQ